MGLFDTVRSLFSGSDEVTVTYGPVARHYLDHGEAPDEEWADAELEGRVNVFVSVAGDPTPEEPVDTDAVEAHLESLDGVVEHAHGGGTVSGWVPADRLADLGSHPDVVRIEVTRPGGDVTDDPDYPG